MADAFEVLANHLLVRMSYKKFEGGELVLEASWNLLGDFDLFCTTCCMFAILRTALLLTGFQNKKTPGSFVLSGVPVFIWFRDYSR